MEMDPPSCAPLIWEPDTNTKRPSSSSLPPSPAQSFDWSKAALDERRDSNTLALKDFLGIEFESAVPWWFRLSGGGWDSATLAWRIWGMGFSVAVLSFSLFQVVVVFRGEDSVYGTEVIATPHSRSGVLLLQKAVTFLAFPTHLFLQIQILRCTGSRQGKHWRSLRLSSSRKRDQLLDPAGLLFVGFLLLSTGLLISGNLVNPGQYSPAFNVLVWGIGGAGLGWLPFVTVSAMFVSDCSTQLDCLKVLKGTMTSSPLDAAHVAYFGYYVTMRKVHKSYSQMLCVQMMFLLTAMLCNGVTIAVGVQDDDRTLAVFIGILCLLQCVIAPVCAGFVNRKGNTLRRTIARRPELLSLLEVTAVCLPGVEVVGAHVSLAHLGLLCLTYFGVFFVGWLRQTSFNPSGQN